MKGIFVIWQIPAYAESFKNLALASVALLLVPLSLSLADDVSMDLRLIQQNVNVGDEVSVNVNIGQVSDLKGVDILISFDLRLEYKSITKGNLIETFVEDIVPDPDVSNRDGKIEYLAVLEEPGPGIDSPGGTILTLNFVARSPGEASVSFDIIDVPLSDSTANAILTVINTAQVDIPIGQIFNLKQVFNYPNPAPDAQGNTVIRVEALALLDGLEANIYDISGEMVKEVNYEDFDDINAPVYEYVWNCRNEVDKDVANGIYILWLKATLGSEEKHKTWKIAVLR